MRVERVEERGPARVHRLPTMVSGREGWLDETDAPIVGTYGAACHPLGDWRFTLLRIPLRDFLQIINDLLGLHCSYSGHRRPQTNVLPRCPRCEIAERNESLSNILLVLTWFGILIMLGFYLVRF